MEGKNLDVWLANKWVYYMGAYKVYDDKWRDKVGCAKLLPRQLNLVLKCVAQFTLICAKGRSGRMRAKDLVSMVQEIAQIAFLDIGKVQ